MKQLAHQHISTSAHLFLLFFAHLLICSSAHSQTVTRQLFGSGGGNATPINATYYVNWSMGEPVVHTLNNGLPQLTQGFQQPEIIIPLAVGRIELAVNKSGNDAFLSWGDHQEGRFMYQVEWLQRGIGWQKLGETPAHLFRHYDVLHENKTIYYRVAALGQDGSIRHSNMVELSFTLELSPTIYPNPTANNLYLSNLPVDSHIQLFDISGKLLMDQYATSTEQQLDLSQFPSALYLLRVQAGEKNFSFKVEVKK